MPELTLSLFGTPCLARGGVPLRLHSRKCMALLAYLAVTGASHTRDTLSTLLWPEFDNHRARRALRSTLPRLRRALDGAWLVSEREAVRLDGSEREAVDVVRFRDLLVQCEGHGHAVDKLCADCWPLMTEAVDLYAGDFMAGFSLRDSPQFDDWQATEAQALQRELASVLERLAEGCASRGDVDRGIGYAQKWVAWDPLHEPAHRCLMRLYARSGRRSEALLQYEACEEVLAEELGVAPDPETMTLCQAIQEGRVGPRWATDTGLGDARHNLPPQPAPFVGREAELSRIAELLAEPTCRLLTVIGPGGIGKTRLVIEAAGERVQHFTHGVCFVALAPVASVDLLASTILDALRVPRYGSMDPKDQLMTYLREREVLLVLDSFEHLLAGAVLITEMLGQAPLVKVLVTSRERLNVRGEWLLPLRGLEYPGEAETATVRAEDYSAVQLFVKCVRRVRPDFTLATAGALWVVRICRLVEGMPLSIELAASWVRTMPCREIAREIEGGLSILTTTMRDMPERHRSMRAVFDHSWWLLSAEERAVLARLSVFWGGFSREAVEVVALRRSQSPVSLMVLSALIDKSWMRRLPSGRYDMHELIRQYCAERLQAEQVQAQPLDAEPTSEGQRESERVRDRHSRYFGRFLQEREEHLRGRGQAEAFGEILEEIDNVWAAWGWALEQGDVETIGRYAEALAYAGRVRRWYYEVMQALDDAAMVLRRADDERAALVLADILSKQALLCSWLGIGERALTLSQESLALLQGVAPSAHGDSVCIHAMVTLGSYLHRRGDAALARALLQEAFAVAEEAGAPWDREYVLFTLGNHARNEGRYAEAEACLERVIAIAAEMGERYWKAHALNNLGWVFWARGEYRRAELAVEESFQIFRELEDPAGMGYGFVRLGEIATALGQYDLAAQHFQRSLAVVEEFGGSFLHTETLNGQGTLALALGQPAEAEDHFEKSIIIAREIGHTRLLTDALVGLGYVALALGETEQARACFCQALERAMKEESMYRAASALMGMAGLLARGGNPERGVELLELVLEYPASTQATRDRAQQLLSELESELSPEALAAATAQGQGRDLKDVVAEILENHA